MPPFAPSDGIFLPPIGAPWSALSPDLVPLAPSDGIPPPPAEAPWSALSPADMLPMAPSGDDIGVPYGYVSPPPGYQAPPYQPHVCGWPCKDSNDCDGPCTLCCYNPHGNSFCCHEDYYPVFP